MTCSSSETSEISGCDSDVTDVNLDDDDTYLYETYTEIKSRVRARMWPCILDAADYLSFINLVKSGNHAPNVRVPSVWLSGHMEIVSDLHRLVEDVEKNDWISYVYNHSTKCICSKLTEPQIDII
jgi:hypothetical protein